MGGFRLKRGRRNSKFLTTDEIFSVGQYKEVMKQHHGHNHKQKICDRRQEKNFFSNTIQCQNIQIGGT